jgi:hypothetical protein
MFPQPLGLGRFDALLPFFSLFLIEGNFVKKKQGINFGG